jgi:hypothetical protein
MLKEVGASGQISLGKKYAGQLFDMRIAPDGAVTLIPVKVVPMAQEEPATYAVTAAESANGWLTPERVARRSATAARSPKERETARNQWEAENKDAIEAMNQRITKIGSPARRIHEWRKATATREQKATRAPTDQTS